MTLDTALVMGSIKPLIFSSTISAVVFSSWLKAGKAKVHVSRATQKRVNSFSMVIVIPLKYSHPQRTGRNPELRLCQMSF